MMKQAKMIVVLLGLTVGLFNACSAFQSTLGGAAGSMSESSSSLILPASVSPTRFGIFYSIWHCDAAAAPQNLAAGQLGPFGTWHWWGAPDAGFYCPTRDRSVLRKHAELLRDAGIDFIYVDGTNFADVTPEAQRLFLDPLDALLAEWSMIQGAPKVSVWIPLSGGGLPDATNQILQRYPAMLFQYQGRPLMEVAVNSTFPINPDQYARFSQFFTLRQMWTGEAGPTEWSFMSPCQAGFKQSNGTAVCNQRVALAADGSVEQISVTAAYQDTFMSRTSTATPKFGGATFRAQMKNVDAHPTAPLVMITGWNEWVAQRLCLINNLPTGSCSGNFVATVDGNPIFTDKWSFEYSRDMEPGGGHGDEMYQLLKSEIAQRKNRLIDNQGRVVVPGSILGVVDSVVGGNGQVVVSGWACGSGMSGAVAVHIYAGGQAGSGGHFVTDGLANLASEPEVANACADAQMSGHRFSVVIDGNTARANVGQSVWVHGISPTNVGNLPLDRSGSMNVPDPGVSAADQAAAQQAAAAAAAAQQAAAQAAAQQAAGQQSAADQAAAAQAAAAAAAQQAAAQQAAAQQAAAQQAAAQAAGAQVAAAAQQAAAQQAAAQQAASAVSTIQIYRFYRADINEHFYTASYQEGVNMGYVFEMPAFRVLANPTAGAHPIFRCWTGGKHFVSSDPNCEGSRTEGPYGYLYDGPNGSAQIIYRLFEYTTGDHLISPDPNDSAQHGYVLEGPIGYAP